MACDSILSLQVKDHQGPGDKLNIRHSWMTAVQPREIQIPLKYVKGK